MFINEERLSVIIGTEATWLPKKGWLPQPITDFKITWPISLCKIEYPLSFFHRNILELELEIIKRGDRYITNNELDNLAVKYKVYVAEDQVKIKKGTLEISNVRIRQDTPGSIPPIIDAIYEIIGRKGIISKLNGQEIAIEKLNKITATNVFVVSECDIKFLRFTKPGILSVTHALYLIAYNNKMEEICNILLVGNNYHH